MKRPVSRNDVAQRAGVAPSTVYNVMNGTKFVSDSVKERVLKAVEELEYEPNLLARSFKMNSTKQISVLINSLENFGEIYRGMYETATAAGYRLSIIIANDNRMDYYVHCYAHRAEGIINLSRFFCDERDYRKLTEHGVAVVNVATGADGYEVSLNYANAVEDFVNEVTKKGHTKIAFIADTSRAEIEPDTRLIAMRYFLQIKGVDFDDGLLGCFEENTVTLDSSEFGYRTIKEIMKKNPDVNAVYCVNDYIALGVYKYLNECGKRIPQDISVCGCDNSLMGKYVSPALSTMNVEGELFGKRCVECILSQLEKDTEREKKNILYVSYVPRDSV